MTTRNDGSAGLALGLAAVLGVLADRLFPMGPGGPGFVLWILALGGASLLVARRAGAEGLPAVAGWSGLAFAAAAGTLLRATEVLGAALWLVLLLSASMVLLRVTGVRLWQTRPVDHVLGLAMVPARAASGVVPLMMGIQPPADSSRRRFAGVARGALLAVPLLLLFGALFASADAGFSRFATGFWSEAFLGHLFMAVGFGWIAAGLLSGLRAKRLPNPLAHVTTPRLGSEETAVALGLLAVLFLTFVGFQVGYLFGGREAIEATSGLTVADYARRGFFEMMLVGVATLAVLLVADALTTDRRVFRRLAAVLVGCVLVILVSAAQRMILYTSAFGLTVDRITASAVMVWVAAVLVLFAATILRERPAPFSSGALILGVVTAFLLVALNPGEMAARSNLNRAAAGVREADVAYLTRLGADAVPTLLERFDELPPAGRCTLGAHLVSRWGAAARPRSGPDDWRNWNAATASARRRVRAAEPALAAACP